MIIFPWTCFISFAIIDELKKDFLFLPLPSASIILSFILQNDPGLLCYNSTTWWLTPSREKLQAFQPLEHEPSSRSMISCCFILILLVLISFLTGQMSFKKKQQSPCLEGWTQMNLVVCVSLKEQSNPWPFVI